MAAKTLRDALYAQLTTACTSFAGFYQPQIADDKTGKPFGVIRMGPEEKSYRTRYNKRFYVHVHCEREDFNTLDNLCKSVADALDDVNVPAGTSGALDLYCLPVLLGVTADAHDDDRETIFRIMEFEVKMGR